MKKELDRSKKSANLLENNSYRNVKYTSDDLSKCEQLKKKGLCDLDLYRKNYKHRYSKKKFLGKIDCYCEQKIFNKYDRIYELAEKLKNDKKSFNKKILKKYGVRIIILGLLLFLGFVFTILFKGGKNNALINLCIEEKHKNDPSHDGCKGFYTTIDQNTFDNIAVLNYVFFFFVGVIIFLVCIYILIKIMKYDRLKDRNGKISKI
ncbi:hypothetical protein PVMG_05512 [Plasmodium vivax Mauritania I]|uniref:Variable surface protein Vir35 n=1 Tax=Plasmodium vivax Mauritania I TaxID=1035515 RepID=A0A0J9TIM7_PLAVI|nr:hypothetical protein PVMG_05512 [Plasmodium vivax Mauritania I]